MKEGMGMKIIKNNNKVPIKEKIKDFICYCSNEIILIVAFFVCIFLLVGCYYLIEKQESQINERHDIISVDTYMNVSTNGFGGNPYQELYVSALYVDGDNIEVIKVPMCEVVIGDKNEYVVVEGHSKLYLTLETIQNLNN